LRITTLDGQNEASEALTKSREFGEIDLHAQLAREHHFKGEYTDELDEIRLARIAAQNDSELLRALGAACGETDHVDCAEDALLQGDQSETSRRAWL